MALVCIQPFQPKKKLSCLEKSWQNFVEIFEKKCFEKAARSRHGWEAHCFCVEGRDQNGEPCRSNPPSELRISASDFWKVRAVG